MTSDMMKSGTQRSAARSLLKSTGLRQEDIEKPWIAVVDFFTEVVPGHVHLRTLAEGVKHGIIEGGGLPLEFNTIAVCDGIAQGTDGMRYSLPSRDVTVDSIEIMIRAHGFDAMVLLPSCDKSVPASLMAAARLNIPSIVVTGGPMFPGIYNGRELSLVEMREFIGQAHSGKISERELEQFEELACPSAGSCSMMATANTMAALTEAIGMSLPGCATSHAMMASKMRLARASGEQVLDLLTHGIRPRDIMTKSALRNAVRVDLALGGSLNSVLHLTALAEELGISDFGLKVFDELSRKTPQLCSLKPSGDSSVWKLEQSGGVGAVMRELARGGLLDASVRTVTGRTLAENLDTPAPRQSSESIVHTLESPVAAEGGIAVLFGNLAPKGAVIKQAALEKRLHRHSGPARVYDSLELALDALWKGQIRPGDVMVVRYEGPKGGPGMREQHAIASLISGLEKDVVLVTDGRFSGSSRGAAIGHVSPEAADGGPIGVVHEGDRISYCISDRSLSIDIGPAELEHRMSRFRPTPQQITETRSILHKYRSQVSSSERGAVY